MCRIFNLLSVSECSICSHQLPRSLEWRDEKIWECCSLCEKSIPNQSPISLTWIMLYHVDCKPWLAARVISTEATSREFFSLNCTLVHDAPPQTTLHLTFEVCRPRYICISYHSSSLSSRNETVNHKGEAWSAETLWCKRQILDTSKQTNLNSYAKWVESIARSRLDLYIRSRMESTARSIPAVRAMAHSHVFHYICVVFSLCSKGSVASVFLFLRPSDLFVPSCRHYSTFNLIFRPFHLRQQRLSDNAKTPKTNCSNMLDRIVLCLGRSNNYTSCHRHEETFRRPATNRRRKWW